MSADIIDIFRGRGPELTPEVRAHLIQAITDRALELTDLRLEVALRESELERLRSRLGAAALSTGGGDAS